MHSLEEVWKYREETLLPALFGAVARGIFPLEAALFADTFGQADIDPRWLHLGVFEFAPTAAGGPIDGGQSPLRHFALSQPTHYPATAQLPSGRFDLLHVVGISEAERDFAQAEGTRALIAALQAKGAFPVTDPQRPSIFG